MKQLKILFLTILMAILACWLYYTGKFGIHAQFVRSTFDQLPRWQSDEQSKAFAAFKQSCAALLKLNPKDDLHSLPIYGKAQDWQTICLAANQVKSIDDEKARQFFETWFVPYHVKNNFNPKGLFTGYYLPLLKASLKRDKHYSIPVYGLPSDLVKVSLNQLRPELPKQTYIGQVKDHILHYPYPDRAAISKGALHKAAPILMYGDDKLDLFFAQIQGSAIVELPSHKQINLGYASGNGQPYTPIGKVLIQTHALQKANVSMQSIREWLTTHPEQINAVLNQNANYVFFRILPGNDPMGTLQVPLTPQRTLAVDRKYIALGVPIWLDTTIPESLTQTSAFQHLLIAQDTGGAIKGAVRGDVYWGAGEKAAFTAGHMANAGEYWVLLPKNPN